MTPFIVPPGEIGTASFDRPAGTWNIFESSALADVESVTMDGAVVNTTAQTRSSNCMKKRNCEIQNAEIVRPNIQVGSLQVGERDQELGHLLSADGTT